MTPTDGTACPMCGATTNVAERKCRSCGEDWSGAVGLASNSAAANALGREPAISTNGSSVARYWAANVDYILAAIVAVTAAMVIPGDVPLVQVPLMVGVYLGYYLVFEGTISSTPGKLLTGLVVVPFDGGKCTWRQVLIRTLFRTVEVNPLLLGGLPACLKIVTSKHRQRFGDRVAGTIVVKRSRISKK